MILTISRNGRQILHQRGKTLAIAPVYQVVLRYVSTTRLQPETNWARLWRQQVIGS
jgi:hypothetical protein